MKHLVVALALLASLQSPAAETRFRGPFAQARFDGADAATFHASLRARPNRQGTKRLELVDEQAGYGLRLTCGQAPGAERCVVTFRAPVRLARGATTQVSELLAQKIVSAIDVRRFATRDGAFRLECEEIYTPTDLPIFTNCWLTFQ